MWTPPNLPDLCSYCVNPLLMSRFTLNPTFSLSESSERVECIYQNDVDSLLVGYSPKILPFESTSSARGLPGSPGMVTMSPA